MRFYKKNEFLDRNTWAYVSLVFINRAAITFPEAVHRIEKTGCGAFNPLAGLSGIWADPEQWADSDRLTLLIYPFDRLISSDDLWSEAFADLEDGKGAGVDISFFTSDYLASAQNLIDFNFVFQPSPFNMFSRLGSPFAWIRPSKTDWWKDSGLAIGFVSGAVLILFVIFYLSYRSQKT